MADSNPVEKGAEAGVVTEGQQNAPSTDPVAAEGLCQHTATTTTTTTTANSNSPSDSPSGSSSDSDEEVVHTPAAEAKDEPKTAGMDTAEKPTDTAPVTPEEPIDPQPETPEAERDLVKNLIATHPMKAGESWNIISSQWFNRWKRYVMYHYSYSPFFNASATPKPGPIDNSVLLEADGTLKQFVSEMTDFDLISGFVWRTLKTWYTGGPDIPRKVIATPGLYGNVSLSVEVRPLALSIVKSSDTTLPARAYFSKTDTVGHLKKTMCARMALDPANVRVWDYHGGSWLKLLNDEQTLTSGQIINNQMVMLEEKNDDGSWPNHTRTYNYYQNTNVGVSTYHYYTPPPPPPPEHPGLVGLENLGNTCFMNSALQCLSNTAILSEFFLREGWQTELNTNNPLGTGGKLANAFSALIHQIWKENSSIVSPRDFKFKLGSFAPQFEGYQQHDSHELLAYLLDGLHEDLNRVTIKPYTEMPDLSGKGDAEAAAISWEIYQKRNQSFIVDNFQGQLKSTVICPRCTKVSITFDPFMYLSLPLPQTAVSKNISVLMWVDGKAPVRHSVRLTTDSTLADLRNSVALLCGMPPTSSIAFADIWQSKVWKLLKDTDSIDDLNESDNIFGFEIKSRTAPDAAEYANVQIIQRKKQIYSHWGNSGVSDILFGFPLIVSVPKTLNYHDLCVFLLKKLEHFIDARALADLMRDNQKDQQQQPTPPTQVSDSQKKEDKEPEVVNQPEPVPATAAPPPATLSFEEIVNGIPSFGKVFTLEVVDKSGSDKYPPVARFSETDPAPIVLENESTLAFTWHGNADNYAWLSAKEKPLEKPWGTGYTHGARQEPSPEVQFDTCLDLFTSPERLSAADPWFCPVCREHQQATKKFDLWRLPEILVVQLKRFNIRSGAWRDRLDTNVIFPIINLDMTHRVLSSKEPCIYDLYAVSNHYGSMGGGHYTASAMNKITKHWYTFDDRSVSLNNTGEISASAAYVLFYKRRSNEPEPPAPTPDAPANTTTPTPTTTPAEPTGATTTTTPTDTPMTTQTTQTPPSAEEPTPAEPTTDTVVHNAAGTSEEVE